MQYKRDFVSHFTASIVIVLAVMVAEARAQVLLNPLQRDCEFRGKPSPEDTALFKIPIMIKWRADLSQHLYRFKPQPATLKEGGVERVTHVAFTINASGKVLESRVSRSSGSPELDEAALRSVQAASPFPAAPPEYARPSFDFKIPFNFQTSLTFRLSVYNPDGIGCPQDRNTQRTLDAVLRVMAADTKTPLSSADETVLRNDITECWRLVSTERISLRLRLSKDGALSEPPSAEDKSEGGRFAAMNAGSELMKCKPFKLDAANYAAWQEIIVTRAPEARNKDATEKKRAQDRP